MSDGAKCALCGGYLSYAGKRREFIQGGVRVEGHANRDVCIERLRQELEGVQGDADKYRNLAKQLQTEMGNARLLVKDLRERVGELEKENDMLCEVVAEESGLYVELQLKNERLEAVARAAQVLVGDGVQEVLLSEHIAAHNALVEALAALRAQKQKKQGQEG